MKFSSKNWKESSVKEESKRELFLLVCGGVIAIVENELSETSYKDKTFRTGKKVNNEPK